MDEYTEPEASHDDVPEGTLDPKVSAAMLAAALPDDFWESHQVLAGIRRYAHGHLVSPEALLGAALVAASVGAGPGLRYRTAMGEQPCTLYALPVGPSGVGKSSVIQKTVGLRRGSVVSGPWRDGDTKRRNAAEVAELCKLQGIRSDEGVKALIGARDPRRDFGHVQDDAAPSSGEGLIDAFLRPLQWSEDVPPDEDEDEPSEADDDVEVEVEAESKPKTRPRHGKFQVRSRVAVVYDEGQVLKKVGGRDGNIARDIMRQAWSGGRLRTDNAKGAASSASRYLSGDYYSFGALIAATPDVAAEFASERDAGDAQRMLFLSAMCDLPDTLPSDFEEFEPFKVPDCTTGGPTMFDVDSDIAVMLTDMRRAALRGEVPAQDAHRLNMTIRLAVVLRVLTSQSWSPPKDRVITAADLERAGLLWNHSAEVVRVLTLHAAHRRHERASTEAAFKSAAQRTGEVLRDDLRVNGVRRLCAKHHVGEEFTLRDITHALSSKHKAKWAEAFGDASYSAAVAAELVARGLVEEIPTDRGRRFRVSDVQEGE